MTHCPDTDSGGCGVGVCNNRYPFKCICFERAATGFWAGAEFGGPCDKCKAGYFTRQCTRQCPGGACSICSGHGTCDDGLEGSGVCTCVQEPLGAGMWTGDSCAQCVSGWFGNRCDKQCTCSTTGTKECIDGRAGTGECVCDPGWEGPKCAQCNEFLPSCQSAFTCPGPPGNECYGHGACERVEVGNDVLPMCSCEPTYATRDCSVQCPNNCSGHGVCSDGRDGFGNCTCAPRFAPPSCAVCIHGYWGPNCTNECPGGHANPCNNGTCDTVTGACSCRDDFGGPNCTQQCAAGSNGQICSGHGTCDDATVTCSCARDDTKGHWNGTTCDVCASTHGGADCATACPVFEGKVCTNNGVCNATTGKCDCTGVYCGKFCDVVFDAVANRCQSCPAAGQFGANCDQQCLCDAAHSTCVDGKSGDGTCECAHGWSGRYCNVSCPGGAATPCSNHGTCVAATSTCVCEAGYGTADCSAQCAHPTCNGNGRCDSGANGTGACVCTPGYVWPDTGCGSFCDCNLHGTCAPGNLTCKCDDRFTGAKCDRCVGGLAGPFCNVTCVNGITQGNECVCNFGWAGDGCDVQCPVGRNGDVCSGHGSCLRSAECLCSGGYVGPACSCLDTVCKAENPLTECNDATGACVCEPGRKSTANTNDCALCVDGLYTSKCNKVCPCNLRGSCDKDTGACSCYTNDEIGYWSGGNCQSCLDGFMGTSCQQRSVSVTIVTSLIAKQSFAIGTYFGLLDDEGGRYLAGGQSFTSVFDITTALPRVERLITVPDPCLNNGGDLIGLWPYGPDGSMLYVMGRNNSCDMPMRVYSAPSQQALLDPAKVGNRTLLHGDILPGESTIYDHSVFIPGKNSLCFVPRSTPAQYWCKVVGSSLLSNGFPINTMALVRVFVYAPSLDAVILGGSRCTISLGYTDGGFYPDTIQMSQLLAPFGVTCEILDCAHVTPDNLLLFGALTQSGGVVGALNLSTSPPSMVNFEIVTTQTSGRCNAISHDPTSNIGLAVFLSTMIKFRFSDAVPVNTSLLLPESRRGPDEVTLVRGVQPYGQQSLPNSAIKQLDFSPTQQFAYAPLSVARGVEIMRFLLVDVERVVPTIADRAGGAVVTVTGSGFRDLPTALCRFGLDVTPATVISANTLTCVAPASTSTETCLTQTVEVTMNNFTYTANGIAIDRPMPPLVISADPSRIAVATTELQQQQGRQGRNFAALAAGSTTEATTITISGRGFVDSVAAKCRFVMDPATEELMYLNASYISPVSYGCQLPPGFNRVTKPGSSLFFALDGQVFSTSTASFSAAGTPAGIRIAPVLVRNASGPFVQFTPPITVRTIDREGNVIGEFDNALRTVSITRESVSGVAVSLNGTVDYTMRNGSVALDRFSLERPDVGEARFVVSVGVWSGSIDMVLTSGSLAALRVVKQPFSPGDVIFPGALLPQSTEVQAIDAAGNIVSSVDGELLVPNLIFYNTETGGINVTDLLLPNMAFRTGGIASLAPVAVELTFGLDYALIFRLASNPDVINATTEPFQGGCALNEFLVHGERLCRPCDSKKSNCNGTASVVARSGHWRASADSLLFYECPIGKACVGGVEAGGCRFGYEGPLCNVCVDNWGKDFTRRCYECPGGGTTYVAVVGLIAILLGVISFYVIATVQNWSAPNSRAGDTVVVLQIGVSYLQAMSLMEHFKWEWPEANERMYSSIGTAADFRFYTILASNCWFRSMGFQDPDLVLLYLGLFALIPVVAALVYGLLRLFPNLMMSSDALVARAQVVQALEMHKIQRTKLAKNKGSLSAIAEAAAAAAAVAGGGEDHLEEHRYPTIVIVTAQVFVFLTLQAAAYYTYAVFSCRDLDYGSELGSRSYLSVDYTVDCSSGYYGGMSLIAAFMAFMYTAILPATGILGIMYSKQQYGESYHRLYTSFLTQGIRPERWYWMVVLMVRKVLLVAPLAFVTEPVDMYLFAWIATFFAWVTHLYQPYEKEHHQLLDMVLSGACVISANLGMAMRVLGSEEAVLVLGWAVILVNIGAMGLLAWHGVRVWIVGTVQQRKDRARQWDVELRDDALDMQRRIEQDIDEEEAANAAGQAAVARSRHRGRVDDPFAMRSESVEPRDAPFGDLDPGMDLLSDGDFTEHGTRATTTDHRAFIPPPAGAGSPVPKPNFAGQGSDRRSNATASHHPHASTNATGDGDDDPFADEEHHMTTTLDQLPMDIDAFLDVTDNAGGGGSSAFPTLGGAKYGVPDRPTPQRPWMLDRMMEEKAGRPQGRFTIDEHGNVVDRLEYEARLPPVVPGREAEAAGAAAAAAGSSGQRPSARLSDVELAALDSSRANPLRKGSRRS